MSRMDHVRHRLISVVLVVALLGAAIIAYPHLASLMKPPEAKRHSKGSLLFTLKGEDTIQVSHEAVAAIGLKFVEVEHAPAPEPLRLPGYLLVDPNSLVPVHSRFPGEVVRIGQTEEVNGHGERHLRAIRFGDNVKANQLLAVIWSTDIGQKKSELVDALSKLALDETILRNLRNAGGTAVPERNLIEAERNVEADKILVNSARRTLRSWRLTEEEIDAVIEESKQLRGSQQLTAAARTWSELQIWAPRDGVVLEKNVNVGEVVDTDDNLFKV